MKFQYSAFTENTPEIREWLKGLGYECVYRGDRELVLTNYMGNGEHFYCTINLKILDSLRYHQKAADCRSNPQLFKAITAVREDSYDGQWFVADTDIYHAWSDTIGNDHDYTISKGTFFTWDLHIEYADIFDGEYHKATLEELIKYFQIEK